MSGDFRSWSTSARGSRRGAAAGARLLLGAATPVARRRILRGRGIPPGRPFDARGDLDSKDRRGRPHETQGQRPRRGGRRGREQDGEESEARVRPHEEEAPAFARDRRFGRDEHDEERKEVAREAARLRERDEREGERHEEAERRGEGPEEAAFRARSRAGRPTTSAAAARPARAGTSAGASGARREEDEEGQGQEGRPEEARRRGSAQRRAPVQIDLAARARPSGSVHIGAPDPQAAVRQGNRAHAAHRHAVRLTAVPLQDLALEPVGSLLPRPSTNEIPP